MKSYLDSLHTAANTSHSLAAIQDAHKAIATLRFHEGLRKRWEHARAEAAIREASALAYLEGTPVSVDDLRIATLNPHAPQSPAEQLALGIWQAQWNYVSHLEPLNTRGQRPTRITIPPARLISGIHRDICAPLLKAGRLTPHSIAIPTDPRSLAWIITLTNGTGNVMAHAAETWARLRVKALFEPASPAVGATLARWILNERGTDPTAVAVISAWHALNPEESARALTHWRSAQNPAISEKERIGHLEQWVIAFARGVEYGAKVGQDIALHIQAGQLGNGHN